MPTIRNTNNSLQTAPVLLPKPGDAANRHDVEPGHPQAPEAYYSDAGISLAMASFLPGLCKLLWLLSERTLRRHRLPSHRPAPRWFQAWQVLPFCPLCLWRAGVQEAFLRAVFRRCTTRPIIFWPLEEDCRIKVGHFSLCL